MTVDVCRRNEGGTVDEIAGHGLWHLEDMGDSFAFITGEYNEDSDSREMYHIRAEDGQVVVERDE